VLHDSAGWSPYQQHTSNARVIESPIAAMLLGSGGDADAPAGNARTAIVKAAKTFRRRITTTGW
jgi:hypothetical protein